MALAGDHAQTRTETWRAVAGQAYSFSLGSLAVALLIFFPPRLDFHLTTVLPVILVGAFLILMERPTTTAAATVAPLTAVMAASAVVFGDWMLVLALIAVIAIRWRLNLTEPGTLFSHGAIGQTGSAILTSYAVLLVWFEFDRFLHVVPSYLNGVITLIAVVSLGLVWQSINNILASVHYLTLGKTISLRQLFRTGIVASIYAYLLVGMYKFGGILAATVFYTVVAQIRVVQDIL